MGVKKYMNKKQTVRTLLEIMETIPLASIPHNANNSIDFEKYYLIPEVAAIITLLRYLKIDHDWLCQKGFIPASLIYGPALKK